jgi:hypothetical protein
VSCPEAERTRAEDERDWTLEPERRGARTVVSSKDDQDCSGVSGTVGRERERYVAGPHLEVAHRWPGFCRLPAHAISNNDPPRQSQ